jgi:hypothetical protein
MGMQPLNHFYHVSQGTMAFICIYGACILLRYLITGNNATVLI